MGIFETLDYDEQVARLTEAAHVAMRGFGYADANIKLVMYVNNAVFEVKTEDGGHFALRLHRSGHKRPEWIKSELVWLRFICHDTPLCVPKPIPNGAGELLISAPVEGLEQLILCSLLEWVEGEFDQTDTVSLERVRGAGKFLARLHNYSAAFVPPRGFARPRLDADDMFGAESAYNPGAGAALFTDDHQQIFARVRERVQAVMAELDAENDSFGMIHADFIMKNILFNKQQVCAIDFDDCSWGYYLYDLAPLLLQFKDEPRYAQLRDALWEGYTAIRPLTHLHKAHVETFIAARHMASCWWLAGNLHNPRIRERAPGLIAHRTAELARFMETGSISQQGDTF